jgi:hypothetical protein
MSLAIGGPPDALADKSTSPWSSLPPASATMTATKPLVNAMLYWLRSGVRLAAAAARLPPRVPGR